MSIGQAAIIHSATIMIRSRSWSSRAASRNWPWRPSLAALAPLQRTKERLRYFRAWAFRACCLPSSRGSLGCQPSPAPLLPPLPTRRYALAVIVGCLLWLAQHRAPGAISRPSPAQHPTSAAPPRYSQPARHVSGRRTGLASAFPFSSVAAMGSVRQSSRR